MKIKNVRVYLKDLGTSRPYTIAFKSISEVNNVFVELELENGLVGFGACNPSEYVVGENLTASLAALNDGDLDFVKGQDIRNFYQILESIQTKLSKNPGARAALDIAVHDVFTQYLGVPLVSFLGQKIKSLPTSVTIGIKNAEDTVEEAKEYYSMGFRVLKVKTGHSVEADIERMAKLREAFKSEFTIRVDANQGYNSEELIDFFDQTKKYDIELIEQPLKAQLVDEFKALPEAIKTIIAADESLITPQDAFLLASPSRASGIFNIKLMKSGGIYPARHIAAIAQAGAIDLMWGCNDESIVSISAALHVALSSDQTKYLDLDGSLDLVRDVVSGGFIIEDGWMRVTDAAGLGVHRV